MILIIYYTGAKTIEYGGVELIGFLPVLISSMRKGNFPLAENVTVRGYNHNGNEANGTSGVS